MNEGGGPSRMLPVIEIPGERPRSDVARHAIVIVCLCVLQNLATSGPVQAQRIENAKAVFAALDKVTARISKLEVKLGETVRFGALKVTPRACYSRPPTEPPKTSTFVEIDEILLDGKPVHFSNPVDARRQGIGRLLLRARGGTAATAGNWLSACALFAYAAAFSFAYISLSAAAGALILFGAVQATMIGYGLWRGERLHELQLAGLVLAAAGLISLLLPGLSAPPWQGALLMLGAGAAWGIYSLRGKTSGDPLAVTAGNFLRTVPFAAGLSLILQGHAQPDPAGIIYAMASGALASGVGYAIWYAALPGLKATSAATVQLSVPVIAAIGGMVFLGEPLTLRLLLCAAAILGGIALVIRPRRTVMPSTQPLRPS